MTERKREQNRMNMRRYYARQRAQGLCLMCAAKPEPNRVRCAFHLQQQAERERERRERRAS